MRLSHSPDLALPIDPVVILNTFIALLPADITIILLSAAIWRGVRQLWGSVRLLEALPALSDDDLQFIRWWIPDSLENEKQLKRDMNEGREPWKK